MSPICTAARTPAPFRGLRDHPCPVDRWIVPGSLCTLQKNGTTFTDRQLLEFVGYFVIALAAVCWPVVPPADGAISPRKAVAASAACCVCQKRRTGYAPSLEPERGCLRLRRPWEAVALARPGSSDARNCLGNDRNGKNDTLGQHRYAGPLSSIGPPDDQHSIPMLILDWQRRNGVTRRLLPHIQPRRPSRRFARDQPQPGPEISVRYNPLHCNDED